MNQFVFKQVKYYYENDPRCEYADCIEKTLLSFEKGDFDLDLLFGENPRENIIINVLCEEFLKMLENEKGNETGVFGVRVGNFSDGITWFYKDLFKSQFVKVNPIFADSIFDLMDKVKSKNELWHIFDKRKLLEVQGKYKPKYKKNKKISAKDIDRKIEKLYWNDDFWKIRDREQKNSKKWDDLDRELDLDESNRYDNLDKMYK